MPDGTPAIGHNNPPDPLDEAIAPYSDAIEEAENWLDGSAVKTEAQMNAVDALLKDVKAARKAADDARKGEGDPLRLQVEAINARYNPTLKDLTRIKDGLIAINGDYKKRLAEEKAAAERKAKQEAYAAAEAARIAAQKADAGDIEAQREASAMADEADKARREASSAGGDRVKGLRTVHRYEIQEYGEAINWIRVNDRGALLAFIDDYVRANHKTKMIKGVKTWTEREAF